jgi:regulator of sigma E protease
VPGVIETIATGVLVLSVLVVVHELGHFLAAKGLGVRVERFSIGFWKPILRVRRGETDYQIAYLLFGGYVKMAGDDPQDETHEPAPGDFLASPWWTRSLIALAGPAANLVLALIFFIVMYAVGIPRPQASSIVGPVAEGSVPARLGIAEGDRILTVEGRAVTYWHEFDKAWREIPAGDDGARLLEIRRESETFTVQVPDSLEAGFLSGLQSLIAPRLGDISVGTPAYQAGLLAGDVVRSVNGRPIQSWQDLQAEVRPSANVELVFVIEREGRVFEKRITPIPQDPASREPVGIIGIMPPSEGMYVERFTPAQSAELGFLQAGYGVAQLYGGLWALAVHPNQIRNSLAGPISVVQISGEVGKKGLSNFLYIAGYISLALMVMNLLPIPILDGGHILFGFVEWIRKRPLGPRKMVLLQRIGFAILGTIMIFAVVNDLTRITQRERAKGRETPVQEEAR